MAFSDVSSATSHFSTAYEGFITTLSGNVSSGATTIGLTSVSGLDNGDIFVGIVEPGETAEQTFTGVIDTGGSQLTSVVWTRGTNTDHSAGATVVDYVSGTHHNLMAKGLKVDHTQTGKHNFTEVLDANGNESLKLGVNSSAVNEVTVTNAATGNNPKIEATGDDTNIDLELDGKGTGQVTFTDGAPKATVGCSVYLSGNQSVPNSSTTTVEFDTENYDLGADFNTSTYKFTAPVSGYYDVHAAVYFDNMAQNKRIIILLQVEGANVARNESGTPSITNVEASLTLGQHVYLASGEELNLAVFQANGDARDLNSAADRSYMTVQLVGTA